MAKTPPGSKNKDSAKPAKAAGGGVLGKLRALVTGLRPAKPARAEAKTLKPIPRPTDVAIPAAAPVDVGWLVDRPVLLEAMWGEGWHGPLGQTMLDVLVRAFGLTREMSVLDLSAGVGGAARIIATEFKTYVTGLEADAELAAYGAAESKRHGMARTAIIKAYDPAAFDVDRRYDCILGRELFYAVRDKQRFIRAVAASMKNYGQICWTDYLVDKKDLEKPAIAAWVVKEGGCVPMALDEVTKIWHELHFDLRIAEDRTEKFMQGTLVGLAKFVQFLQGRKIADPTKPLILNEIEIWAYRLAAMKAGMKLYRFYALRK